MKRQKIDIIMQTIHYRFGAWRARRELKHRMRETSFTTTQPHRSMGRMSTSQAWWDRLMVNGPAKLPRISGSDITMMQTGTYPSAFDANDPIAWFVKLSPERIRHMDQDEIIRVQQALNEQRQQV
jgi:hypothetical protein